MEKLGQLTLHIQKSEFSKITFLSRFAYFESILTNVTQISRFNQMKHFWWTVAKK